jgi:hypothetical protein
LAEHCPPLPAPLQTPFQPTTMPCLAVSRRALCLLPYLLPSSVKAIITERYGTACCSSRQPSKLGPANLSLGLVCLDPFHRAPGECRSWTPLPKESQYQTPKTYSQISVTELRGQDPVRSSPNSASEARWPFRTKPLNCVPPGPGGVASTTCGVMSNNCMYMCCTYLRASMPAICRNGMDGLLAAICCSTSRHAVDTGSHPPALHGWFASRIEKASVQGLMIYTCLLAEAYPPAKPLYKGRSVCR